MPVNSSLIYRGPPQQPQQTPMQQLAGLMQIVEAQKKGQMTDMQMQQLRETQPLLLEEMRIKNQKQTMLSDLIKNAMNQQVVVGQDGMKTQGGDFAQRLRIARALNMIDPPRGRAEMEALKLEYPDLKWEGGIPLNPRTGQIITGAPVIPQRNQQGFATTTIPDKNGVLGISVTPGAEQAFATQQRIAEGAKAASDLVLVPPTAPDQPPTYRSRAQLLPQGAGPAMAPAPAQTGPSLAPIPPAVQQARDGDRLSILLRERESQRAAGRIDPALDAEIAVEQRKQGGAAPMAQALVAGGGVAAGMSPKQEATAAANKEFQVTDAKARAQMYDAMQKGAMSNTAKIAKFERVGNLLKDYDGGKMAQTGFELARFGTSLGVTIDPKLPNKEAAVALANEVALDLRSTADGGGMPGALSDADREFLRSMTPQLGQTAEGRKKVIESRVAVWKREQKVAEMARQYRQKHGTVDEDFFNQLQAWSNRNPIFNAN